MAQRKKFPGRLRLPLSRCCFRHGTTSTFGCGRTGLLPQHPGGPGGLRTWLRSEAAMDPRGRSPTPAPYLHLPQGFGAGGGRGGLPAGGPQEDVLPLPVLVAGEELLLLGVEQPHHVPLSARGVEDSEFSSGRHRCHRCPRRPGRQPHPRSPLTPFRVSSLLSLHFMNRTIFQLVLQLTELTCKGTRVPPSHSPRNCVVFQSPTPRTDTLRPRAVPLSWPARAFGSQGFEGSSQRVRTLMTGAELPPSATTSSSSSQSLLQPESADPMKTGTSKRG